MTGHPSNLRRDFSEIESARPILRLVLMPNEEDEEMSLDIWCDLLERELKIALEDLEKIRKIGQGPSEKYMPLCSELHWAMLATI